MVARVIFGISIAGRYTRDERPSSQEEGEKMESVLVTGSEKMDLLSLFLSEITDLCKERGEKAFRARQIYEHLHVRGVRSFQEMTNLSLSLRESLDRDFAIASLGLVEEQVSRLDGTRKYLFALPDGNMIESVLMKYSYGLSVCISSQVGCRMGCRFCASTIGGKVRDLTAGEMLSQVTEIERLAGARVSHIVVMGSGEPFDNYDNLLRFLRLCGDGAGEKRSLRNITVSTSGLVEEILRFGGEGLPVTLALSLHASNQKEREALMPIARKYEIKEVINACRVYFEKTGRRVTFEYSLVSGVNDSREAAERLGKLLSGFSCHVNLIPVNPVRERSFRQPSQREIQAFAAVLEKYGEHVTIRREMGRDIQGACGQLRAGYLKENG